MRHRFMTPHYVQRRRETRVRAKHQEGNTVMKTIAKLAIGAAMVCGAAVAATAPAQAGVHVGIGIGVPAIGVGVGAPCGPYDCGYPGYYAPGYIGVGVGGWG